MNERYLWLIIFRSGNKVDGLHQKVVVEDLVNFQQQMQTDFAVGKGKYHSFNVKNEIFEAFVAFLFNFHVVVGLKVRNPYLSVGFLV